MSTYTGNKVFAPAIFFIAFREALEASLVIGILSGMLERIVMVDNAERDNDASKAEARRVIKKLRRYIYGGALTGLLIAFAIGAAFLAVFYTQTTDLYGRTEELWEGIFNLIAVCLITPMSLAILRADRSRNKWRRKLSKAFAGLHASKEGIKSIAHGHGAQETSITSEGEASSTSGTSADDASATGSGEITPAATSQDEKSKGIGSEKQPVTPTEQQTETHILSSGAASKSNNPLAANGAQGVFRTLWTVLKRPFTGDAKGATAIFIIPMVTTLREGLEGVVFIGGVSLGLPATSIPLPAIVGLFSGLLCGYIVFKAGSFSKVRVFLILSTCVLLIISAGMISRAVYYLQFYQYIQLVGSAAAESGNGPASYDARNYVWHLDCCNPENTSNGGSGWAILNSLVGWNNTANIGSLLSYIFYWLAIASYLVYAMVKERRTSKMKRQSRVSV